MDKALSLLSQVRNHIMPKEQASGTFLDKGSWISVGLFIFLAGGIFAFGVMFNRVETLTANVASLSQTEQTIAQSEQQSRETLSRLVQGVADLKSEFDDFKSFQQQQATSHSN